MMIDLTTDDYSVGELEEGWEGIDLSKFQVELPPVIEIKQQIMDVCTNLPELGKTIYTLLHVKYGEFKG